MSKKQNDKKDSASTIHSTTLSKESRMGRQDGTFSETDFDTRAVRYGAQRTCEREHNEPVFLTSSYVFADAQAAAGTFRGEEDGNVYSRFTNPTVSAFERRLASLENGAFAIGTASGMGAITLLVLAIMKQEDRVILGRNLFGSTLTLFKKIFSRFGVEVEVVDLSNLSNLEAALQQEVRLVLLETPSNPLCDIVDIKKAAAICNKYGTLLAVDNCFCTPALQRPLELGADIVIHSATKYLDGQGRCIGGALVVDDADIYDSLLTAQRSCGLTMSPFNAWVFNNGLETLSLRMEKHSSNALKIAQWLLQQSQVERVYYAGLESHKGYEVAKAQQSGFGGVLSFEVKGGEAEAWRCIDSTSWLSITGNLGDVKTTITHSASTTHGKLSDEDRANMGIKPNLIRLSVGLENYQDIIADLTLGLKAV